MVRVKWPLLRRHCRTCWSWEKTRVFLRKLSFYLMGESIVPRFLILHLGAEYSLRRFPAESSIISLPQGIVPQLRRYVLFMVASCQSDGFSLKFPLIVNNSLIHDACPSNAILSGRNSIRTHHGFLLESWVHANIYGGIVCQLFRVHFLCVKIEFTCLKLRGIIFIETF